ncbi:hypothetical protein [Kineococcus sp. SYSU DK005]|uniref:hypothetical protein n=1 Tax=Kineococcus sp. SYSU DK005 TaxID=3383126 RepID=UPI003D7DAE8D
MPDPLRPAPVTADAPGAPATADAPGTPDARGPAHRAGRARRPRATAPGAARRPAPQRPALTAAGQPLPRMPEQHLGSAALRDAVAAFVLGRPAPGGAGRRDVRSMLLDAYGPSRRDPERPDLSSAAQDLGMSTRQLQRWVRGETTPQPGNPRLQKLARRARAATGSRAGRRRALGRHPAPPPEGPVGVRVGGVQGVLSSNDDQYRDRVTETSMSAQEFAELQRVWVEHGHRGAVDFLHAHFDRTYVTNWHFESIDTLTLAGPRGR